MFINISKHGRSYLYARLIGVILWEVEAFRVLRVREAKVETNKQDDIDCS